MNRHLLQSLGFVVTVLASASTLAADSIQTIRIFETNDQFVLQDKRLSDRVQIEVYDMDSKNRATKQLNQRMRALVPKKIQPSKVEKAYRDAFSQVLNSPHWPAINQEIQAGARAIEAAMRFGIEKLPAIVFNDRQVVYGERSLKAALAVYSRENH